MDVLTFWDEFERQALDTPNTPAVWSGRYYPYSEIAERAVLVGDRIRGSVPPGGLIALLADDYAAAVVGLLAAARAHCPVLRVSRLGPALYQAAIMSDARPCATLEQEAGSADLRLAARPPDGGAQTQLADAAYVIYTSGSTGRPKGVVVSHQALLDRLRGLAELPGLAAGESMLAMAALSFDMSVAELFLPLMVGGCVIAAPAARRDQRSFRPMTEQFRPSVIQATPSFWRLALASGWAGAPASRLWCGGEALTPALAEQLLPLCAELWNLYGPTEATVWASAGRVAGSATISLGSPLPGTGLALIDQAGLPIGEAGQSGEIVIYGQGLATSYLGQPTLTQERFTDLATPDGVRRCYRTGDRAVYGGDGKLVFRGRDDNQIKLRGFRIELGELESVMEEHPAISEAIAVLRHADDPVRAYISAFAVPVGEVSSSQIRGWLSARLPSSSLPRKLTFVPALPRTEGGKVDRVALAEQS
jgi:D-alanine--poly(phosphoribitol) ligase subunit 1